MESRDEHISVLLNETISALNIKENGCYVDCTLGGGGHSEQIVRRLSPEGCLIGIDQDDYAISRAEERLASYPCKKIFVRDNFIHLPAVLDRLEVPSVDGVIFDLGVSSFQFDQAERGFSYHHDGPLDMRMDRQRTKTAADVVNHYSESEIKKIIYDYGEDKMAGRIAKTIVSRRKTRPFTRTLDLADVIRSAYPEKYRRKGHPAKKTFQALRIEVNDELKILMQAVKNAILRTKPGGRVCVITFHSLEDRQIKRLFNEQADPCICPPEFPVCVCGRKPTVKKVTRKPIVPSAEEVQHNRRARSAKLRVVERISS